MRKLTGREVLPGAFISYRSSGAVAFNDSSQINPMDSDGSDKIEKNFTSNSAADIDPAFFPDHHKIACVSNTGSTNDIYVMKADGSARVNLTHKSAASE